MKEQDSVYRDILTHLSDGVLSVDRRGRIMTFNPAASHLLDIAADAALGRTLAEIFIAEEGLDDFSQAIIDAVQGGEVGHRRAVEARIGDEVRLFTLVTSYLRPQDGNAAAERGEAENRGVIAVFADVTEIRELQQTEQRLAKTLEAQHAELQGAYRELEASNQTLATALKKVQIARVAATIFVIVLIVAFGAFLWNSSLIPESEASPQPPPSAAGDVATITVAPKRFIDDISVTGHLTPRREVLVTSPAGGEVAESQFQYGQQVVAGQQLLKLDTTKIEREHREAQAAYIKASKTLEEIEDWANSTDMARIRRDLSKARLALDNQKTKLDQTTFLLQQGIVSAAEHRAAERHYQSQLLDYDLLERNMQTVVGKGDADAQEVARLKLENAHIRVLRLEETLRNAMVAAPIAGIVLQPERSSRNKEERPLVRGQTVSQGEHLFTIGDVERLSIDGWVDEADINKIDLSQRIEARGDAFPGLKLRGTVAHVSRQARPSSSNVAPTFQFIATLEEISPDERRRLRLGMSAIVKIVVLDKPNALVVPISAVRKRRGKEWLYVRDPNDGSVKRRRVKAGKTNLNEVEIVRGVSPGDEVVVNYADGQKQK